jgi:Zn finger protein HypA/HybF involved in hydrogenase expression
MHETTLAKRLLQATIAIARDRRVVAVRGWIAESEPLDRASIEAHFSATAAGTVAEGARLELRLDHVAARCAECGAIYLPTGHLTLCTQCGCPDAELTGRTGAGIDALEVED